MTSPHGEGDAALPWSSIEQEADLHIAAFPGEPRRMHRSRRELISLQPSGYSEGLMYVGVAWSCAKGRRMGLMAGSTHDKSFAESWVAQDRRRVRV